MTVKLSETEIKVGILYFLDKLSPREIASKLNLSINTVYKAVSKVRAKLKELGLDPDKEPRDRVEKALLSLERLSKQPQVRYINKLANELAPQDIHEKVHINSRSSEYSNLNVDAKSLERSKVFFNPGPSTVALSYSLTLNIASSSLLINRRAERETQKENTVLAEMHNVLIKQTELLYAVVSTVCDYMDKLVRTIQMLVDEVRNLCSAIQSHRVNIDMNAEVAREQKLGTSQSSELLPDFIRDNVWVDIIRSKYST